MGGDRQPAILGYVLAGVLAAAVLAGLVAVIASGGDDESVPGADDVPENAHVQVEVGVFKDLKFDDREGTPPPEIQFGDLEESAKQAGCELMLNLPNEGSNHLDDEKYDDYKTNPPTSGDHFASTEAGSGACQVKFAAVRPGPHAAAQFERLLDALERFAAQRGAIRMVVAVNTACDAAYRAVLERGFRTFIQGVVMQRPNEEAFHRRAAFVLDDLR